MCDIRGFKPALLATIQRSGLSRRRGRFDVRLVEAGRLCLNGLQRSSVVAIEKPVVRGKRPHKVSARVTKMFTGQLFAASFPYFFSNSTSA